MGRYYAAPRFLCDLLALRRNIRRKRSELVALQEKRLRAIVRHAYATVPFYHRLLNTHNINPTEIRTVDDLEKLPMITKREVQENLGDMFSRQVGVSKCIAQKTSGSMGVPLTILKDRNALNFQHAVSFRQSFECGERLRDKVAQVRWTGSASVPRSTRKPFYEHLGFLRNTWVSADQFSLEGIVDLLNQYEPDVIVSYPGILQMVVESAKNKMSSRLVFSTGEILSEHMHALISEFFGARVIDSYGCVETGDIAWECPQGHGGYHMNIDSVVVEFVRSGENVAAGEDGEIVLTNLFNYAMPLIRYRIGDVGSPSGEVCSCGRTLPLMHSLRGRRNDFVVLPDGRKLSPWFFWNMIDLTGVSEFRIVQEKRNVVRVWLRIAGRYEKDQAERTAAGLRSVFGDEVNTMIEIVDELPQDHSGKLRCVISNVSG
jgi:phenylacetate-CoA ligase